MKIRITADGTERTATLNDSQTTQNFLAPLPLTLTLEDYAGTEKVSDLPALICGRRTRGQRPFGW